MAINANDSRRPSLHPLWTNYRNLGGLPKTAFRPAASPQDLSPSPMSPKSLPSPMYPIVHDAFIRRHEQAMVKSLDGKARRPSPTSPVPLRPINEEHPLVERLERFSILPINHHHNRLPNPPSPPTPSALQKRESFQASESVAIHQRPGAPSSPRVTAAPQKNEPIERYSPVVLHPGMPEPESSRRCRTAVRTRPFVTPRMTAPPRSHSRADLHSELRMWGHIYYGNAKTADAFVIARSLRQHSNSSAQSTVKSMQVQQDSPKFRGPNRVTVRAIIRPRALERQSFLIQRNFNIDELRATIPDSVDLPSSVESEHRSINAELQTMPLPTVGRRNTSSVKSGTSLSDRDLRSSIGMDRESLLRDAKTVPIHLKYARAYLPVLAALLLSGHVRDGDVIYLPLPHANAWPHTVKYIYTGQGELTPAIKDNIMYLAGKV